MEIEELCQLIQADSESNLGEFSYEENGVKISMSGKSCGSLAEPFTMPAGTPSGADQPGILPTAAAPSAHQPLAAVGSEMSSLNADVQPSAREEEKPGSLVTSPLVGVFYTAPSEDAAPFVKIGDQVKEGQVIAIVEAMKLMNEIECDCSGTVAEILVENGQAVEYGQPLFRIVYPQGTP